jgi:hypothetical protein
LLGKRCSFERTASIVKKHTFGGALVVDIVLFVVVTRCIRKSYALKLIILSVLPPVVDAVGGVDAVGSKPSMKNPVSLFTKMFLLNIEN